VQKLFRAYFSGAECEQKDIERRRCNVLKCTSETLIKQALGCISTVAALNKGIEYTIDDIAELPLLYWNIRRLLKREVFQNERATYGQQIIDTISRNLTRDYGTGLEQKASLGLRQICGGIPYRGNFALTACRIDMNLIKVISVSPNT